MIADAESLRLLQVLRGPSDQSNSSEPLRLQGEPARHFTVLEAPGLVQAPPRSSRLNMNHIRGTASRPYNNVLQMKACDIELPVSEPAV